MKRDLTLTAAQLAPEPGDTAATLLKAFYAISDAAAAGPDLVSFAEVFLADHLFYSLHLDTQTARPLKGYYLSPSLLMSGPVIAVLADAAQHHGFHVVIGISECAGDTLYNVTVFLGPGGLIGWRRKVIPTRHERMAWDMSDGWDFSLYKISIGRLGGLICFEHSNARCRYVVRGQGHQIHVGQWPGGVEVLDDIMECAKRHDAFEAQCPVVTVMALNTPAMIAALGKGGSTDLLQTGGGLFCVIDCRGQLVALADPECEMFVHGSGGFDQIEGFEMFVDSAGHYARPDIYRCVVDKISRAPVVFEGRTDDK